MDLSNDVDAVHDERGLLGHSKGDVEHGAVLGHVDVLAAEHLVATLDESRLVGELEEQFHGLVGDPVFGVVEIEALGLGDHSGPASRIVREELTQMTRSDLGVVGFEGLPRGTLL